MHSDASQNQKFRPAGLWAPLMVNAISGQAAIGFIVPWLEVLLMVKAHVMAMAGSVAVMLRVKDLFHATMGLIGLVLVEANLTGFVPVAELKVCDGSRWFQ